jgi:hypothetical protein
MDLTISRQDVHLVIVKETNDSTIDKLDLELKALNLDDPNADEQSDKVKVGLNFDYDNNVFLDKVVETGKNVWMPYEIWSARSEFNKANIVWYDANRIKSVKAYLKEHFGQEAGKIIDNIEFQKNNE